MAGDNIPHALTFDDVLLLPGPSAVLPSEVDLSTRLTRRIRLNIPILSAAMDTVTEADTAISLARQGGIGIIHRNLSVEAQVLEVEKMVQRSLPVQRRCWRLGRAKCMQSPLRGDFQIMI